MHRVRLRARGGPWPSRPPSDTHVLVVATDLYSRILDFSDRRTAVLFGDGAGAAVVGSVPEPHGIIDVNLSSHDGAHQLISVEAGRSRQPISAETVAAGGHYFRMDGRGVRDFVIENVPPVLECLVARSGFGLDQADHFVPVLLDELVNHLGLSDCHTIAYWRSMVISVAHRFPWHLTTPTDRAYSRTAIWYCSPGSAVACR